VCVERSVVAQLGRLVGERRRGQVGVQQAAVAGHPAARRGGGDDDLVGQRRRKLAQIVLETEVAQRAGRVKSHARKPPVDRQTVQQRVRPLDRIEHDHVGGVALRLRAQRHRARTGIDHQRPWITTQRLGGAARDPLLGVVVALGAERLAAAQAGVVDDL
jgi:hypothetical protein